MLLHSVQERKVSYFVWTISGQYLHQLEFTVTSSIGRALVSKTSGLRFDSLVAGQIYLSLEIRLIAIPFKGKLKIGTGFSTGIYSIGKPLGFIKSPIVLCRSFL